MKKEDINPDTKISALLQEHPELMDFFLSLGLCGCEYGHDPSLGWPLWRAAKEKNLQVKELIEEIKKRLP